MSEQDPTRRRQRGFTLVEALITVALLGILVLLGTPTFLGTLNRTRLTGTSRQLATLMQAARLEAIKKNTSVKVQYDSTMRRFWGFVDNDQDGVEDSGERRIAEVVDIGKSVQFRGPGDSAPNGAAAIDNWDTLTPATNGPTFRFDGSVDDVGAYRLSDSRDNVLEVRVSTAATGRIVIQKWDRAANIFRAAGENVSSENGIQPSWTWY